MTLQNPAPFQGSNPENRAQVALDERFALIAAVVPEFTDLFQQSRHFLLTIPRGGMVQKGCRAFPALQENYEQRIRTRTPEYLEFFPVPR